MNTTKSHVERRSPVVLLALALLGSSTARADVFEIAADGSCTRVDSGAVETAPELPASAFSDITASVVPPRYAASVAGVTAAHAISPALLEAVVWQESRWRADATSSAGALGLTQLMPATARELGVDPHRPADNLAGGARYLRQQLDRFDGNVELALAAYNAGPSRVARTGTVPAIAETRAYVAAVLGRLAAASTRGD